jgi:uncharacterized membrane protein
MHVSAANREPREKQELWFDECLLQAERDVDGKLEFQNFDHLCVSWRVVFRTGWKTAELRRLSQATVVSVVTPSIAVWATTVLIFSVAYWRIDRGGPEARANHANRKPDWLFPQDNAGEDVPSDWRPTFVDYLFLAFCTATAFSPTDVQPLTSRSKLLMMLESTISLVTTIAVAARAINILGT